MVNVPININIKRLMNKNFLRIERFLMSEENIN